MTNTFATYSAQDDLPTPDWHKIAANAREFAANRKAEVRVAEAALVEILKREPVPLDMFAKAIRVIGEVLIQRDDYVEDGCAYYITGISEHGVGGYTGGYIVASESWLIGFFFDLWMRRLDDQLMGVRS